jgi:hypothetical protein
MKREGGRVHATAAARSYPVTATGANRLVMCKGYARESDAGRSVDDVR